MASELKITIESVYVERTGLFTTMAVARNMEEGTLVAMTSTSAPAGTHHLDPTKTNPAPWEVEEAARWMRRRQNATHDTPELAVQGLAAWIVEVMK